MKDADGRELGWWDLVADAARPTAPGAEAVLAEAIKAWQAGRSETTVVAETAASTVATPPALLPRGPDFLPPDLPPTGVDPLAAPEVQEVRHTVEVLPPQGPPVVDLVWNRPR